MEREIQAEVLKWMLKRVKRAKAHQAELAERLERINAEREAPIGSPGYEPLPRVMEPGAGAASILFKLAEIEERIYEQKKEIEKAYVAAMDIIDFIPPHTDERRIFELRFVDCMTMYEIADAIPLTRSKAYQKYNNEIYALLEFPKIQEMVKENHEAWLDWYVNHGTKKTGVPKKQGGGYTPGRGRRNKKRKK